MADGRGGWVEVARVKAGVGEFVEIVVPWHLLSLSPGDLAYLVVAAYRDGSLVDYSSRVGMTHLVQVPRLTVPAGAKVILEIEDPVGDDKGPGDYSYPLNPVFREGVFDITLFRVVDAGSFIRFETQVRDLGGNPWGGPNGFSLQYIHIYIRTTMGVEGSNETFGLNVALDRGSAWHVAILVAPGWGSDPVPQGERSAIYYHDGSVVRQDGDLKVYADPGSNAIVVEVSKGVLPDVDNADKWVYTVALTSYDGYGPERIRPFGVEAQEWVVGVGAGHAQAVLFNVIPRVMDLLAPSAEEQYEMLSGYAIDRERGVALPSVISGLNASALGQEPVVVTETLERTATVTISTTETVEVTRESVRTVTTTYTETREDTVTVPGGAGAGSIAASMLAGVALGAAATMLALRRRGWR
jgi:carbohydrate-binding DOMON domain-containing protein